MKRVFVFSLLLFSLLCKTEIQAQGTPQKKQKGIAAAEGAESGLKWGIAVGGAAVFISAFGLIIYLASTDPVSFSHCHSHSHCN